VSRRRATIAPVVGVTAVGATAGTAVLGLPEPSVMAAAKPSGHNVAMIPLLPCRLQRVPGAARRSGCSRAGLAGAALASVLAFAGCGATPPEQTPPIAPGSSERPREVNILAHDYGYSPAIVDLVPGETVLLHVVNGGLDVHEAILGTADLQLAWEAAEEATVGHPPGPTPAVSVAPGMVGLRIVVASGERVDVTWTVPRDAPRAASGWFVGCHIPGHWQKGMVVPIRFVDAEGQLLAPVPPPPIPAPGG
jgi:uncharacterized cupredoxin-like copper-binding protein